MPLMTSTIRPFNDHVFIETGSYEGMGISAALDAGYKKIISIEISEFYLNLCKDKFKDNPQVELILGDSSEILGDIINNIDDKMVFWLDGHYSGGDKPKGKYLSPLLQELEFIKNHPIKNHTILIDDVWCWKDMNNIYHNNFNIDTLIEKIKNINTDYEISYVDGACFKLDILQARIK